MLMRSLSILDILLDIILDSSVGGCVFSTLFSTLFCELFYELFCTLFCVLSTMPSTMFSTMLFRSCWAVPEDSGCSTAVVMRQSAIQSAIQNAKSGTLDFRVCFWKLSQTLLLFFC